jgi:hypothetical protein
MAQFYALIPGDRILLQASALPDGVRSALFTFSLVAALGLCLILFYRWKTAVFHRIWQSVQQLLFPEDNKREARLERVICFHCNKGMGIYNPIYVTYQGESYIEGMCNCCGKFVRARLR